MNNKCPCGDKLAIYCGVKVGMATDCKLKISEPKK